MDVIEALQRIGKGKRKNKKGLPKRTGKRAAKYKKYYAQTYHRRKLARIMRHNGRDAARRWAEDHGCLALYRTLSN